MTAVRNVLVSGAGVAGPTLAHWLHRHGIEATVVERAPRLRRGGHAVDLRGVALDVIEPMGLLDEVVAHRTEIAAVDLVDARGRRLAGFTSSQNAPDGRSRELLRGDLVRLLYEPTTEYAEYLYDDSVVEMEQGPDRVRVGFERAGSRRFDLVVGADGLHSTTRRIAFGPEEDHIRPLRGYISIFTVPDHLGLGRRARLFNLPGLLMGMYHTPRAEGATALLLVSSPEEPGVDRLPPEEQKEFLRRTFAGAGWESGPVLAAMGQAPTSTSTRSPRSGWAHGRPDA